MVISRLLIIGVKNVSLSRTDLSERHPKNAYKDANEPCEACSCVSLHAHVHSELELTCRLNLKCTMFKYLQASWGKAQVLPARDRVRTSTTCTSFREGQSPVQLQCKSHSPLRVKQVC